MDDRNSIHPYRIALLILGWVFVGLGFVGAVVPLLPTTPFLLLALWCFARSSRRFHHWLINHRLFGPTLQNWESHRVIPPLAKVMSITAMSSSMAWVVFFSSASVVAKAAMGAVCAWGAWYVLTKPSRPKTNSADPPPDRAGP